MNSGIGRFRAESRESRATTWVGRRRRERGPGTPTTAEGRPTMLIALKALGATCLAGALAASGALTTEHLGHGPREGTATATLVSDPTTTTTEPPTTTTTTTEAPTITTTTPPSTAPPPPVVTLAPPVEPTVIPVAGAGTVVLVLQGPVVVVRGGRVVPGWAVSVERR